MHADILDAHGQQLMAVLGRHRLAQEFYLAGGTGLALHLGHRLSRDLDFFTRQPRETLPTDELVAAVAKLWGPAPVRVEVAVAEQLDLVVDATRVSLVAYPFPLVYPLAEFSGLAVADPREIALMKAYALGRRATARDYVDLYFLLRESVVTLPQLLAGAAAKFVLGGESVFSPRLFLTQLVWTADLADKDAAVALLRGDELTFAAVEDFLRRLVRDYVQETLPPERAEREQR